MPQLTFGITILGRTLFPKTISTCIHCPQLPRGALNIFPLTFIIGLFYVQYKLLLIVCRGFVCRDTVLVSVFRICIIFMRIRIRDPKNVHTDPDPRGVNNKEEILHKQIFI